MISQEMINAIELACSETSLLDSIEQETPAREYKESIYFDDPEYNTDETAPLDFN